MSANDHENNPYLKELHLAVNSSDIRELKLLIHSRDVNVRRAVAKNNNIDTEMANTLAMDPVLNVSYIASQHKNCTFPRKFRDESINHQCILCTINEHELDCTSCKSHQY